MARTRTTSSPRARARAIARPEVAAAEETQLLATVVYRALTRYRAHLPPLPKPAIERRGGAAAVAAAASRRATEPTRSTRRPRSRREERAPVRGRRRGHRILGGRRRARRGRHVVEARGQLRRRARRRGRRKRCGGSTTTCAPKARRSSSRSRRRGRAAERNHVRTDGVGLAQRHEHRRDDGLSRHARAGATPPKEADAFDADARLGATSRSTLRPRHFAVAARGGGHHPRRRIRPSSPPSTFDHGPETDVDALALRATDARADTRARSRATSVEVASRRRTASCRARVSPMGRARRAVRALPLDARSERRVLVPPVRGTEPPPPSPVDRLDASATTHHQRRFEARRRRYRRPPLGHPIESLCITRRRAAPPGSWRRRALSKIRGGAPCEGGAVRARSAAASAATARPKRAATRRRKRARTCSRLESS